VCCSVLQCVAVCCRVLQCVAVCCSVLQCAAVCCSMLQCIRGRGSIWDVYEANTVTNTFLSVTWLVHICDMTHSYVWHDSFICVTWLIHLCDVTHSYARLDSSTRVAWPCICAASLIDVCVVCSRSTLTSNYKPQHILKHTATHCNTLQHTYKQF